MLSTFWSKYTSIVGLIITTNSTNPNFVIILLLVVLMFDFILRISFKSSCGGGWVLEVEISDRLWLEPSLGQAEQYSLRWVDPS